MEQYYLILDTSNKSLAIGLANPTKVLFKTQYEAWQKQAELAVPEIANILKAANITIDAITKIIVTKGPGSYTGIRIALTIAKVLALAKQIPIVVISSLQALAGIKPNVLALIDARSSRCYVGRYHLGKAVEEDTIMYNEEINAYLPNYQVVGDVALFGLANSSIDIIENIFLVAKDLVGEENIHLVKPAYLKD